MRILVTGFGAFLAHTENPSDRLARALGAEAHAEIELVVESPLPVVFAGAAAAVLDAAQRTGADGILALGLASASPAIRVERRAHNLATSEDRDMRGVSAHGELADPTGPAILTSSIDVVAFASVLNERGIDANPSDDAGGYVCNDLYYRLLVASLRGTGPRRVLFVHVPRVPDERTAPALLEAVAATFLRTETGLRTGRT